MSEAQSAQPLAARADKTLVGIGLALLGLFLFAANNALMKWVVARYPVSEALAIRSVVSMAWIAPFLRRSDFFILIHARPWLQAFRVFVSSLEILCFFTAVSRIPLADVSVLYLATPIYVTALSPILLKEHVGWRRWCAVLVGFAGVLIALRPSGASISPPALLAFCGGLLFAFVTIATRGLRALPNRLLIATQVTGVLIVALALAAMPLGGPWGSGAGGMGWIAPQWSDVLFLAPIGTLSMFGYAAFNASLRIAPASVVSPFQYSSILWAILFGVAVFGDAPAPATLLGAAIIIAAGLFIFWREITLSRTKH